MIAKNDVMNSTEYFGNQLSITKSIRSKNTILKRDFIAMAPTEASILSSYLLNPASLPTIVSLEQFQELFPRQHRSNSSIRLLYKDLQFLRTVDVNVVEENINREAAIGERQKLSMYQGLHQGKGGNVDVEQYQGDIDIHVFGPSGSLSAISQMHDKGSLLREMEKVCRDLESQIQNSQSAAEHHLEELRETIGGLSDLRYGKFSKVPGSDHNLAEEVVTALKNLDGACEQKRLHR